MKKAFILMAFRNLLRYRTRNLLTGVSIALGALSIIVGLAFTNGIIRQTIVGFTGTLIEDVMIYPKEKEKVLKQYKAIQKSIYEIEGIDYVTKKMQFMGPVFSDYSSLSAIFMGMEPEGIRRKDNLEMVEGEYLDENDHLSLILSRKLANRLKVTVGDKVAIVVNMPSGGTNANDFRVKGIFNVKTGLQFVDHLIYISLWDTQDLMGLTYEDVFNLGVYLIDVDAVDQYEKIIADKLKSENFTAQAFSWKKIMQVMIDSYLFVKYIVLIFTIILVLIVTTGVVNAVYMAVSERTREIGTMMAMGAKRKIIISLFMMEGMMLSLISTIVGAGIGTGFVQLIKSMKIEVNARGLILLFGGKTITPYLDIGTVLYSSLFVMTITLLGIAYPIFKASKLEPTRALGFV